METILVRRFLEWCPRVSSPPLWPDSPLTPFCDLCGRCCGGHGPSPFSQRRGIRWQCKWGRLLPASIWRTRLNDSPLPRQLYSFSSLFGPSCSQLYEVFFFFFVCVSTVIFCQRNRNSGRHKQSREWADGRDLILFLFIANSMLVSHVMTSQ